MPIVPSGYRTEYEQLWGTLEVRPERRAEVARVSSLISVHRERYVRVSIAVSDEPHRIPWEVIGAVHLLETGLRFDRHLHNGDPLTARTVHVPIGRPKVGVPPFSWEQSAQDALLGQGWATWDDWSVAGALYALERYNGMGYRRKGINSPYLWSGSNHYTSGKYVADGKWDAHAVSKQIGAAVVIKGLGFRVQGSGEEA